MTPAASRRTALRGSVAVAVAGLVGTAGAKAASIPVADAALIAASRELVAAERSFDELHLRRDTIEAERETEGQVAAMCDQIKAIQQRIEALDLPTTMAGCMALVSAGLASAFRASDGTVLVESFGEWCAFAVLEYLADHKGLPA